MAFSVSSSYNKLQALLEAASNDALPALSAIEAAAQSLPSSLPNAGLGEEATATHLLQDITPAFSGIKTSSNYYGFVTGGVLPIAELADNIVTAYDQSTAVHLPDQSINTTIEDRALRMLIELVDLGPAENWPGKIFTTGATASNILGLACGREFVINQRLEKTGEMQGVGELGLLTACAKAGIKEFQILTSMGHSSLYKAASVVGIGRAAVKDVAGRNPWEIDLQKLETGLKRISEGVVSIVAVSAGEVNTGRFATDGLETMQRIRELCDLYGAWLHVDGAFGLFARTLPQTPEFATLHNSVKGLELADSITGDGHKLLNVPYDCGFFFTRSPTVLFSVFQNANAAYLATGPSTIASPMNIGLENSRRFRALPVYSVLVSYGLKGFQDIFVRQVRLAREISRYLEQSATFEVLAKDSDDTTHMVVIFRAKNEVYNQDLAKTINSKRKIFVSGTRWDDRPAVRFAISTWKVDVDRDLRIIKEVLDDVSKA
ncbi:pyridoxal-dependent decarboxylase [Phlyctema vagabunda]|uniref:Pyridoxal-dependent decarboxylase n=1 Tax=Phlyctema vagabunda TaxID=108571 RepID=A0ABR4PMK6_9HELO